MEKIDYKKVYKDLYTSKELPNIITVPPINFVSVEGLGNPNSENFRNKIEALYSFSYFLKMNYKNKANYYDYTMFPLEGIWDIIDKTKDYNNEKDNLKYKIMIRQPEFLEIELFKEVIEKIKIKKPNENYENLCFEEIEDGLSCQILHIGSYDNEAESFSKIEKFCEENKCIRKTKIHREIYLSDHRKVETSKLKTILRVFIKKQENEK